MNRNASFLKMTVCLTVLAFLSACNGERSAQIDDTLSSAIVLQDQGGFSVGGRTVKHDGTFDMARCYRPEGQTAYGDHAYVFYQIPAQAREFPLIFLHGGGMTKRCWSTTPDGRDGFQNIFLRKGFGVYLVDQPRIGESGSSTEPTDASAFANVPNYDDRRRFTLFRLGEWPELYPGVQFPKDSASIDQFLRQGAMTAGEEDRDVTADAMAALLEKIGPAVLVTHSANGTVGWRTALRTNNLKAIVSYEPGGGKFGPFLFPKGEARRRFHLLGPHRADGSGAGRVRETHENAHRHLLRGQYRHRASCRCGTRPMARRAADGTPLCGNGQSSWRKLHGNPPARNRHQG